MSENSIVRSSAIMAAGTFVSRITGLIRGLLLVAVLGTKLLGDTFNVANTMPNILYNLIIGGALTAVFVPQMVRAIRGEDGGSAFISRLVTATSVVLGLLVLVSIVAAPLLVRIFASSYVGRPEFNLTVLFMRYCLPQIFFMGLFALLGQVANAKGKFGPMMWAPVFNNIVATHKMSEFSIQSASVYKIWIFFLVRALRDHLPETLVSQLWDKVARNAFPSSFQYSFLSHPPRTLKDFPKTIETRASLFRDTTNSLRHDSIDNYRSPPSSLHQQHGGTLSSPNHSSLHSPTRRQVAAVTTSIQEPCGNCDNRHHTTVTCPHIRFCLQCDRVAEDSNHYPSDCKFDHSHESD